MDSIKKNRMRLIPGVGTYWGDIAGNISEQTDLVDYISAHGGGSAVWGSITGNLSEQVDLMEKFSSYALLSDIPSLDGYATESWVSSQGFLTSEALSGYATESWVVESLSSYALLSDIPSLDGYATESWVSGQGYLTSSALSGYATESWVSNQGYLTSVPSGYATESWVSNQGYLTSVPSGYATQSWVENQDYVSENDPNMAPLVAEEKSDGYLMHKNPTFLIGAATTMNIHTDINSNIVRCYCAVIDGHLYAFDSSTGWFYEFNMDTFRLEPIVQLGQVGGTLKPLWADTQGRIYYGTSYILNIDPEDPGITEVDLGGNLYVHQTSMKTNLIQRNGVTYLITNENMAYIFNEQTQLFDSFIPVTGTLPEEQWYRYFSEFDGHWIYDKGSAQIELVFHLDAAEPYVEWVTLENRLFPGAWSYEYDGQTINETTRGIYVHPVTKNGVTTWCNFGYANKVMYKLVNGAWQIDENFNQAVSGYSSNAGGCYLGTLWFGYGYVYDDMGGLMIWNMDSEDIYDDGFYGWDTSVDTRFASIEERLTALEQGYGNALSITNEILG